MSLHFVSAGAAVQFGRAIAQDLNLGHRPHQEPERALPAVPSPATAANCARHPVPGAQATTAFSSAVVAELDPHTCIECGLRARASHFTWCARCLTFLRSDGTGDM